MLSDEVRQRIGQLHRGDVAARPRGPHFAPAPVSRDRSGTATFDAPQVIERGEECENASGKHLRIRRPLTELWPGAQRVNPFVDALQAGPPRADLHWELAALATELPRGTMFLDLETCGFAGSPVFLAGLVWLDDEGLMVDQLLARDYSEERALLESLWEVARQCRVLVTYNGKSFDWPMVHDRSTRHHLGRDCRGEEVEFRDTPTTLGRTDARPELAHCDLLHHARRRWRHVLPNCRLQTLEQYVCRRWRKDDLPGAEVPAAYHRYVRDGRTEALEAILHHNALDLATLVHVALVLLAA